MGYSQRTDLALELNELREREEASAAENAKLPGLKVESDKRGNFNITRIEVLDEEASVILCKPIGKYLTLELDALMRREENSFAEAAQLFAGLLGELLSLSEDDTVLVVGLGNRLITPDAVGPCAVDYVMVTRHLLEHCPEQFGHFREVSAIATGVLGTTGVESADMIRSLCSLLKPSRVIAIDALSAMNADRLCRTVQLSNSGIVPGSGIGNGRAALNETSLGVPVIAIGTPTVVEVGTLMAELKQTFELELPDNDIPGASMIVTPKDIDKNVSDISRLIGYGLNLALHEGLSIEDVDMLVG